MLKEIHKNPSLAINAIIHNEKNQILLIKRKNDPFKDSLALPGGVVNHKEKVEDALRREAIEELALNIEPLEILGVYSDPNIYPNEHIISIVFICLTIDNLNKKDHENIAKMIWININELDSYKFAFDHKMVLEDYVKWRFHNSTYWSSKIR